MITLPIKPPTIPRTMAMFTMDMLPPVATKDCKMPRALMAIISSTISIPRISVDDLARIRPTSSSILIVMTVLVIDSAKARKRES
jgi:hypothetical protein